MTSFTDSSVVGNAVDSAGEGGGHWDWLGGAWPFIVDSDLHGFIAGPRHQAIGGHQCVRAWKRVPNTLTQGLSGKCNFVVKFISVPNVHMAINYRYKTCFSNCHCSHATAQKWGACAVSGGIICVQGKWHQPQPCWQQQTWPWLLGEVVYLLPHCHQRRLKNR